MITTSLDRLEYLCNFIPERLSEIDEEHFSAKPSPTKWSKKQILGHLIDSAANNHHKWIRGQFEDKPFIRYDQDSWNAAGHYNEIAASQLIAFWKAYNVQILSLIKLIPEDVLQRQCFNGSQDVTLEWLFDDYVVHLEHHMRHIVSY
jgi:hypothetical protein